MGKLKEKDASCRDDDDNKYPYGMYKDIENSGKCVRKCVRGPGLGVLDSLVGVITTARRRNATVSTRGMRLRIGTTTKTTGTKLTKMRTATERSRRQRVKMTSPASSLTKSKLPKLSFLAISKRVAP